jgi:hypothetical protein
MVNDVPESDPLIEMMPIIREDRQPPLRRACGITVVNYGDSG